MTCQLLHRTFRGLLSVYVPYGLQTRQVASATLYTEGSDGFVAFTVASIATGWSDPVPGWDLHPLLTSAFHGAHEFLFITFCTGLHPGAFMRIEHFLQ
jgi:hypothetical protein